MSRTLLTIALHAYGTAAVLYLWYFVRPRARVAQVANWVLIAGFVLHGAVIVLRYRELGVTPVTGLPEGLSFLAWLLVGSFLVVNRLYTVPALGTFVAPLVLAVLVPAMYLPHSESSIPGVEKLLPIHVTIALLGTAALAIATGVSLMYVLMEREMKFKRFGVFFSRLPSLEKLDDLGNGLVRFGFVALSVTIATGAFFAKERHGGYFEWSATQTLSLVAWLVYGTLVNARALAGWRGRRVALLTVVGFLLLLVSLAGTYALPKAGTAPGPELSAPRGGM
jgi:ABC-type uncharacterized transport system permease subunit